MQLGAVPALGIADGETPLGTAAAAASTGAGNTAETSVITTEQKSVDENDSAGTDNFKKVVRLHRRLMIYRLCVRAFFFLFLLARKSVGKEGGGGGGDTSIVESLIDDRQTAATG